MAITKSKKPVIYTAIQTDDEAANKLTNTGFQANLSM